MITLYLKRIKLPDHYRYILRETYADKGILRSRDLMDMGRDPSAYIHYPGGNGFYFDSAVENTLRKKGAQFSSDDLEEIFEPFLHPRLRELIHRFQRGRPNRSRVRCDLESLAPEHRRVHIFDARRLYYLRFGRFDSGELAVKHWKFLDVCLCKSRDEIESIIEAMERTLPPGEFAAYVYGSLGVPLFFAMPLRDYPHAISREKIDDLVVDRLCRLNSDENFFLGVDSGRWNGLHPYLVKYAWLYFDFEFMAETWTEGFWFEGYRSAPPQPAPAITIERAREVFGLTEQEYSKMTKKELIRLYRRKAKRMHPDRGGVHEDFVKLSEAYEQLLARKQ